MINKAFITRSCEALTLVEMLVTLVILSIIGVAVFSILSAGTMLAARNFSLNLTNNSMRVALDRVEQLVQQANNTPSLVDTSGNAAASPAPGITFDYFKGGPYVVTVNGPTLTGSSTSLSLIRTTNSVALAPVPVSGDVIQIDTAPATVRALVASVTAGVPDGSQHQAITATLSSALGSDIPVPSSGILTAHLVRKAGVIVMPAAAGYELRYYPSYETTTDLTAPAQYVVLTREIGLQAGDATPFTLTQIQAANFVNFSLRVRSTNYDGRLFGHQADQFNTFARVDTYIRPKTNPP